jgi:DNA-binding CsgD family transcriptional regulator
MNIEQVINLENQINFKVKANELRVNLFSHQDRSSLILQHPLLTEREAECFYYLGRGYATKKIAKILNLSTRTVEGYINATKEKMGVIHKSELVEKAVEYVFTKHYELA